MLIIVTSVELTFKTKNNKSISWSDHDGVVLREACGAAQSGPRRGFGKWWIDTPLHVTGYRLDSRRAFTPQTHSPSIQHHRFSQCCHEGLPEIEHCQGVTISSPS